MERFYTTEDRKRINRIPATDRKWMDYGACLDEDPDALFVSGAAQNEAKSICTPCPVRIQCMLFALATNAPHGVWGGLTERERRVKIQENPDRNWFTLQSYLVEATS